MIRLLKILIFTCSCFISQAQVNIITTIAGKDTFGYSGDGGPATNAKLKAPTHVACHKTYMYICDALNHRIRKVDFVLGIITTIAGTSSAGYFGDGNIATNAQLQVPQGLHLDTAGNIYITDAGNSRIRKIDLGTGIITTIAGIGSNGSSGDGGLATNAELNLPGGLHVDKVGHVYIPDWGNNKIRKIDKGTGIITTIAGNGIGGYSGDGGFATSAELNGPSQVFVDNVGDILIAEQYNHVVRKVEVSTGVITTVAGSGVAGYSGDAGLAVNASLNQPTGLFVDKQNNIYIAEYGNGTIRKIDCVTGIITTVAGTGVTGFSGDGGLATDAKLFCTDMLVDEHGNLIIADYENNRIRKVNNAVAVNGIDKVIESKLYPNPTKGAFSIHTPMNISLVSIYNIAGMRVYERTCTTTDTEIDISNQPPGVYIVYVLCGEQMYVSKVAVIR
ncbi:MAG: T9SS type A sorting domain-containing protein [Taibaiella sp.]|nr:T9SS type A sorting domain-containing protein [Taibaiella sp.]